MGRRAQWPAWPSYSGYPGPCDRLHRCQPADSAGKVRVLHEIIQQSEEANRRLERMASALLQRVSSLQEKSQEVSRRASTLIVVTSSLVLALAAMSAWLLSRRLLRHVGALLTGTRKIMQGELGYRVAVTQSDEVGQLAGSFNAMAQEPRAPGAPGAHRECQDRRTRQAGSLVQSEKLAHRPAGRWRGAQYEQSAHQHSDERQSAHGDAGDSPLCGRNFNASARTRFAASGSSMRTFPAPGTGHRAHRLERPGRDARPAWPQRTPAGNRRDYLAVERGSAAAVRPHPDGAGTGEHTDERGPGHAPGRKS